MIARFLTASAIAINIALPAFVLATEVNMQVRFNDVDTTNVNAEAIYQLRGEGVISGYADNTFKPDATINRAEFTKIIIGAAYNQEDIEACVKISDFVKPGIFDDVMPDVWYFAHLCKAFSEGVISGYETGTFNPSGSINYAEASKIIALTFHLPTPKPVAGTVWYKPYMDGLRLTNGLPTSFKSESQLVTRGEMAFMIASASHVGEASSSSSSVSSKRAVGEGCKIGGCSGQMCISEGDDGMSTCEYREVYACYQTATCMKQPDGDCGWTQTDELTQCLTDAQ